MKKFEEIVKEIKSTYAHLDALRKESVERRDNYINLLVGKSFKEKREYKAEHEAELKENNDKLVELEEKEQDELLKIKFLQNNARIALFQEVVPVVLEVLEKYKNKPCGEKTKKKIADEIKEKTQCGFYFKNSCSFCVFLNTGNYDIEVGTKYQQGKKKHLLIDNKIQIVSMEDLEVYHMNKNYCEDVEKTITELKQLRKEAKQKQEELEAICSQYNHLAVDGIQHLDVCKHIYSSLI